MPETDVRRLLSLFDTGDLVRPSQDTPNTVDLSRALAAIAGAPQFESEVGARRVASLIGEPEHLVFVLADGLGMNLVERMPPDAFLRRHLALELNAVFPSSTAPALTALATGVWPAAHAVPTWFSYLPEAGLTGVLLPFTDSARQRSLAEHGLTAGQVFPLSVQASFFARDFCAMQPASIAQSLYTRYVTGGPPARAHANLEAAIDAVIERTRTVGTRSYTYLYFPEVDSTQHDDGVDAASVWAQVQRLDAQLARLHTAIGVKARVVVSADHGQVTVTDRARRLIDDGDELMPLLRVWPPAGEPRMTCFHVRPGCREEFAEAFHEQFGRWFCLLSVDEAEALQLFGPSILSPATRGRVGDFLAIPTGPEALIYAKEPGILAMKGMHGALSRNEMRIPLVVS